MAAEGRAGTATDEADVFDALLTACCPGTADTIVVAERTVEFRSPGPAPTVPGRVPARIARNWRSFSPALLARLDTLSRPPRPVGALSIPRTRIVLTDSLRREIFALGIREGWEAYHRRFPGLGGYHGLSPVAFNAEVTEAVVYLERHCGGLCGDGTVYKLQRRNGVWAVTAELMLWVS